MRPGIVLNFRGGTDDPPARPVQSRPGTSNGVVQLCIEVCVHLVDGVHSGRVINQEEPHICQTVLLFHFLSFRQSLEEV